MIGTRLGAYEITAKLGEGGMGEVYRATDSKLKRDVAIKVLPAAFTEDTERLARFEREAQLLAQLQHPNIASIYGLEESGGTRALVMELVEGPTLAERLEQGALPLSEVLSIARQIAEALEEAHEKGIIHRDLKPQNVKASRERKVKVLDFGLAKAMDPTVGASGSASQLAASPTLTLGATMQGVILGTAAYMAPEQAKGFAVDKRADIWAFGVVLFEMLSGRSLFAGDSVPDTLARVLQREVDFAALPETTPPSIRRLLRRCLERSPKSRLHDIADARIVIEEELSGKSLEAPAAVTLAPARRSSALPALSAVLLATAALTAGWLLARRGAPVAKPAPLRLSVVFPDELAVESAQIAPDGASILFSARRRDDPKRQRRIYRRDLGAENPVVLAGAEDNLGFWFTSDGRSIFFTGPEPADPTSRRMLRMPIDGAQPPTEIVSWDRSWTDFALLADGDPIVVDAGKRLRRIVAGGDAAEPVAIEVGKNGNFSYGNYPNLPGGEQLMTMESWSGHGYQMSTALVEPLTGRGSILIQDGGRALFRAPERILFSRGSTLLGVRFDSRSRQVVGRPVALVEGLRIGEAWEAAFFGISNDGTLAFAPGGLVGAERGFAVLDPAGEGVEPWSTEKRAFVFLRPEPSSDGRFVYTMIANAAGTYEIWRVPRSGAAQPVIALPDADANRPTLSPDGRTIAFSRIAQQPSDGIYLAPVGGGAPPRELLRNPDRDTEYFSWEWTPDGDRLLAVRAGGGEAAIVELSLGNPAETRELVPASAWSPTVSPTGRRLAFASDISGRPEVYVADYPMAGGNGSTGALGERVAVSRDGGSEPAWSPDGKTLYFLDRAKKIIAVSISLAGRPTGEPREIADGEALRFEAFNVLADGRLLLLQRGPREDDIRQLDLILHFDRILEERLP